MKDAELYQQVWKKYLPVITLKLKQVIRSNEPTHIGMYRFEFHSSSKKTKLGHQFDLHITKGKVLNSFTQPTLVKELMNVLKEDSSVRVLLSSGDFSISLNADFILTIQKKPEVVLVQEVPA